MDARGGGSKHDSGRDYLSSRREEGYERLYLHRALCDAHSFGSEAGGESQCDAGAGKHAAPVSDLISPAEVASVAAKHLEASECEFETGEIGDDMWYRVWTDPRGGETVIAYRDVIEGDGEEEGEADDGFARKNVARNRKKWVVEDLKVLPDEDAFLAYEDPQTAEECEEQDDLAELIGGADIGDGDTMGVIDAMAMQAQLRVC